MRHKKKKNKLNRSRQHTKATFYSIAGSVIEHGSITTSLSKAKKTQPIVDKLITLGKKNNLHARRLAAKILRNKDLLKILFEEAAPRFKDRNGGYTRVVRKGYRIGDAAALAILELVEKKEEVVKSEKKRKSEKKPEKDQEQQQEKKEEDEDDKKKGIVDGLRGFFKKNK